MNNEELKEWDNALLDLINKGLVKVVDFGNGRKGFKMPSSLSKFLSLKWTKIKH